METSGRSRTASARFGMAQSAEIKLNGNKLEVAYCVGSVQHSTVRRHKTQLKQMEGRALRRHGSARHAVIKLNGNKWKVAHCFDSARHRPFGTYRNSSGKVDRAKRSEGPKRAEGQYNASKRRVLCVFCSNWFLMPIVSEAVRGRSLDPSWVIPCRAEPIQCAPSLRAILFLLGLPSGRFLN
jgi:hypothetical protein